MAGVATVSVVRESTQTEYIRVTPTSEQFNSEDIPRILESLHKLTKPTSATLTKRLNPFHTDTPLRFEFLAVSGGSDESVEFLYGADEQLETLEDRLRSIYPHTFDLERVEIDLLSRLITPVEFTKSEFVEHYNADKIQYEFEPDEQFESTDQNSPAIETSGEPSDTDDLSAIDLASDRYIDTGETILECVPATEIPNERPRSALRKPTLTPEGTVLARKAVEAVTPLGVRWCGSAARKQDWMSSITPYTVDDREPIVPAVDQRSATVASLIDHLMEAATPIAFQVVFQRRSNWEAAADVRKQNLIDGRDTLAQEFIGSLFEVNEQRNGHEEHQLSERVAKRIKYIDAKNSKRSFTVNIRAIGVPTDATRENLDSCMESLRPVFDPLDGPFYGIVGKRLREKGFREKTKTKNARRSLHRLLNREVITGRGNTCPDLVLSGGELANFVLVPSSEQLTVEGTRGTRAEQQSRNPLPRPDPDLIQQFQEGMAIGYAIGENGEPQPDPIRIPPDLLTTHYGRFASTGGGKSKAIINDALSLRETTSGPVVIVDPKGDGMCENYLKCHYEQFGDLDDVYQFRIPKVVPAFSFFDIRPALEAGRNREDAVQDKVDHFHDILRMIMGRERYDQAFVANEILSYLIKSLFDEEYGSDAFGLDELFTAGLRMQRDQTIPPVSAENQNIEESLTRHFAKDDRQFQVSMDAVGNRLDKLKEDAHLRRIFSHAPEKDDAGDYVDNRFDFREFLDEDVTILFDLGDLRPEAQRAITLLLLSNLWDAVQVRRRDGQTDYEKLTNLIIEEAASVASTQLVSEQLLPQGRSFGLSMGLVMQFPEQVRNRNERAYDEVLNNIKMKLIGNISIERDLAESLAHEDLSPTELRNRINTLPSGEWIAQLPSPSFGETGPSPFSLSPLPISAGHPESDQPLTESQESNFETVSYPRMIQRTQTQYGLTAPTESSPPQDEVQWGGSERGTAVSANSSSPPTDPTQSVFISQPTTGTTSMSSPQTNPESGPDNDGEDVTPLFEDADKNERKPVVDDSSQPENGSTPVQASGVTVPDAELQQRGLSHDDVRFLNHVLDVMNREDDEYTLLDRMSKLRDEYETLHMDQLTDQDLLEEDSVAGRKCYTVLPAGQEFLGEKLKIGPGRGDLGEKTPHKVGVRLLECWLQQQDNVDRVEPYYEYDDETVFDVAGFDAEDTLVWVGEAELSSNNSRAPVDDYDKLSAVDTETVWAFNSRQTAVDVLDTLADANRIEETVSGRAARSFSNIRNAVNEFDAAGLTTVRSFKNLKEELDS